MHTAQQCVPHCQAAVQLLEGGRRYVMLLPVMMLLPAAAVRRKGWCAVVAPTPCAHEPLERCAPVHTPLAAAPPPVRAMQLRSLLAGVVNVEAVQAQLDQLQQRCARRRRAGQGT